MDFFRNKLSSFSGIQLTTDLKNKFLQFLFRFVND